MTEPLNRFYNTGREGVDPWAAEADAILYESGDNKPEALKGESIINPPVEKPAETTPPPAPQG